MPYVSQEQIERAKEMDLLTYLQTFEPGELVLFSGNVFTTRTHDSLKISNGKWCWWSRGIGGRSALDYLIKVRGMTLPDAVNLINGHAAVTPPTHIRKAVQDGPKTLLLPERNENDNQVIAYLLGRGIHRSIIDYCIRTRRLYESRKHHNAVFIGFDPQGVPRYGMRRGTSGSRFMGDVYGSDKRYSFSVQARDQSKSLHLFESAIELLSFGTLEMLAGRDWRSENLLSLAGVYKPRRAIEESSLPAALGQYLEDNVQINTIVLHLNNDCAGRLAAEAITANLKSSYVIENIPPSEGNDYNELLQLRLGTNIHIRQHMRLDR